MNGQFGLDDAIVTRIREIGRKYSINQIVLFGSRARGDHHQASDIDLAVFLPNGFNQIGHLYADLDDLDTLLKIDLIVVDENTEQLLMENIRKEGVVLYGIQEQQAAELSQCVSETSAGN